MSSLRIVDPAVASSSSLVPLVPGQRSKLCDPSLRDRDLLGTVCCGMVRLQPIRGDEIGIFFFCSFSVFGPEVQTLDLKMVLVSLKTLGRN